MQKCSNRIFFSYLFFLSAFLSFCSFSPFVSLIIIKSVSISFCTLSGIINCFIFRTLYLLSRFGGRHFPLHLPRDSYILPLLFSDCQLFKLRTDLTEYFHQSGRKYATLTVDDHMECFLWGEGILITPFIYQCIIYIRH